MKTKIKLKDVTKEEFEQWVNKNCENTSCKNCTFKNVMCTGPNSWVVNKGLFSDKFLNQEIEIEIEIEILDEVEKEYLTNVIKPFRNKIDYIIKRRTLNGESDYIVMSLNKGGELFILPYFKHDTMYKGMNFGKQYTLEDLGL